MDGASGIWRELDALWPAVVDLGLERVRAAAEHIGLQQALNRPGWVLVAGTNGKGSTATALARVLEAHGLRVGLYTSPHLFHPRERVCVNGIPIRDEEAERCARPVLEALTSHPVTYFEATTLMALTHFSRQRVDVGVLEVGLGGRLDATNIVEPSVSIITSIELDHTAWLGDTREQIAFEKGGVTRASAPWVHALSPELEGAALRDRAVPRLIARFGEHFEARWSSPKGPLRYQSRGLGPTLAPTRLTTTPALRGPHQAQNLACALAAAQLVLEQRAASPLWDPALAAHGVACARVPARLQRERIGGVEWIFDGAHNPAGAAAVSAALGAAPSAGVDHGILVIRREKDAAGICKHLHAVAHRWHTAAASPREGYWPPESLAELLRLQGGDATAAPDLASAMASARALGRDGGERSPGRLPTVLVSGSLYGVAEAMRALRHAG